MGMQGIAGQLEAWRAAAGSATAPVLAQARAELVAAQNESNEDGAADDHIEKIEQLLNAQLEPIILKSEMALAPLQQAVAQYFETAEEPTDEDTALQEQVDGAVEELRDWLVRKVDSIVAQAYAKELAGGPAVATHATSSSGHCGTCGAALNPAMIQLRCCQYCRTPL